MGPLIPLQHEQLGPLLLHGPVQTSSPRPHPLHTSIDKQTVGLQPKCLLVV